MRDSPGDLFPGEDMTLSCGDETSVNEWKFNGLSISNSAGRVEITIQDIDITDNGKMSNRRTGSQSHVSLLLSVISECLSAAVT